MKTVAFDETLIAAVEARLAELEKLDAEYAHGEADDVLCELLRYLGFERIVDLWDAVPKWYA